MTISLADYLKISASSASQLAELPASQNLLAETPASTQQVQQVPLSNLLEIKQVLSKLIADLQTPSKCSKPILGFRLLLAEDESKSQQVSSASPQQRGGEARAAKLSPERRREIAMRGVAARKARRDGYS